MVVCSTQTCVWNIKIITVVSIYMNKNANLKTRMIQKGSILEIGSLFMSVYVYVPLAGEKQKALKYKPQFPSTQCFQL